MFTNTRPIIPNDFWWHMAIGREIVNTGVIPAFDIYSYTMLGESFSAYQRFWLSEIGLYGLYGLGGPELVIFVNSLMITSAYGLLLWLCRKISKSWRISAVAVLFAVLLGITNWTVRPQTTSILLGVIYLVAIYSYRTRPHSAWLALFPLGMLVWVNSHGSFVIGLVLIAIWIGDELWRLNAAHFKKESEKSLKMVKAAGLSFGMTLLASLVNPGMFGSWAYVRTMMSNPVIQNLVGEWAAPTLDSFWGAVFLISLLFSTAVLALSPKRPDFFQMATFIAFGILGFKTTRGVIWFGLVMAPIMSDHFSHLAATIDSATKTSHKSNRSSVSNFLILIFLVAAAVFSLPWLRSIVPMYRRDANLISSTTPIKATQFLLEEDLPGELFNDMGFGSYLIWEGYPDYKVFADPRIDLYPPEIWQDYLTVINAMPGWEKIMIRDNINTVILNPEAEAALVAALEGSPSWNIVYEDITAVIFTRSD